MYKLSKVLNLTTVSFISELGDQIFCLINVDEETLKYEAENVCYPLPFQIGSTDLISMEPTNESLVPLRYCNLNKPEYIKRLEQNLRPFFMVIYENDLDSIMNQQVGETSEINDEMWNAYKEFLIFLNIVKIEVLGSIKMNKELKGYIIRNIYEHAIEEVKKKTGFQLINLWDHFKEKEMSGYTPYFSPDPDNPIDLRKNKSIY